MSTPTRQEIIDAHEALEELCKHLYGTRYAKLAILKVLPPLPQKTMAEVEWDDDKHYLAEAHSISGLKVVMLHRVTDSQILCLGRGDVTHWTYYCNPEDLTPTGRKYELKEKNNDRTNP